MANIKSMVETQINKGYIYLNKKGDFMTEEKVTSVTQKAYLSGLKDGSIGFEKSFEDFKTDTVEKCYTPTQAVMKYLEELFPNEEVEMNPPETDCTEPQFDPNYDYVAN